MRSRSGEGKRESIRARTQSGRYRSCKAIHPSRRTEGRSILVASGRTAPVPDGASRTSKRPRVWRSEWRSNRAIPFGSSSFTQTLERSTSSYWAPTNDEVGADSGKAQSPKAFCDVRPGRFSLCLGMLERVCSVRNRHALRRKGDSYSRQSKAGAIPNAGMDVGVSEHRVLVPLIPSGCVAGHPSARQSFPWSSSRKISMPAQSPSFGHRWKQWRTTKSPSAMTRLNSTCFPGNSRAMRSKILDKRFLAVADHQDCVACSVAPTYRCTASSGRDWLNIRS